MKIFRVFSMLSVSVLTGCINMNPNGPAPRHPYYITKQPVLVRKIVVPSGTKLSYENHIFRSGQQSSMLGEESLQTIDFPEGMAIDWGGVPVTSISKFFNEKMTGFTVTADFDQIKEENKTKFSELWESTNDRLSVSVKNIGDWSFNTENIYDVESCGVNNQRYFKDDMKQQNFLDSLLVELKKVKRVGGNK